MGHGALGMEHWAWGMGHRPNRELGKQAKQVIGNWELGIFLSVKSRTFLVAELLSVTSVKSPILPVAKLLPFD
ncbi:MULTISPECIES: hypothetical protein [unclassified Microcoleus]|uniref:hypothetical protein n=1 Tax=unclassified Microcoleus TaxID=2642155 RepID=UPI002FD4B593